MNSPFCMVKKKFLRMFQPKKTREKATKQKREREREKRENFLFSVVPFFYTHEFCTYLFTIFFFFRISHTTNKSTQKKD